MVTVDSTLFHANWCGHCKNFLPEWNDIKKKIEKIEEKGGLRNGVNITYHEYESDTIDKNPSLGKINGKDLRGYPTIRITVSSGKKSIEYEYDGKRKADELLNHITEIASKKLK